MVVQMVVKTALKPVVACLDEFLVELLVLM